MFRKTTHYFCHPIKCNISVITPRSKNKTLCDTDRSLPLLGLLHLLDKSGNIGYIKEEKMFK